MDEPESELLCTVTEPHVEIVASCSAVRDTVWVSPGVPMVRAMMMSAPAVTSAAVGGVMVCPWFPPISALTLVHVPSGSVPLLELVDDVESSSLHAARE